MRPTREQGERAQTSREKEKLDRMILERAMQSNQSL